MNFQIVFEDEDFLAAHKPPQLPSQPTLDKSRPDFYSLLKTQLQERESKEVYLALHHRLDKETSGVMLFAKTKRANSPLAEMFKKQSIHKAYWCLINAKQLPSEWTIKSHLAPRKDKNSKRTKMHSVHSGGDLAITHFKLLEQLQRGQLIQAQPQTGRMHQIRVHLSEQQRGIYGDDLYHSPQVPKPERLMLHAHSLSWVHPFTQEKLLISSPPPEDFIQFMEQLNK